MVGKTTCQRTPLTNRPVRIRLNNLSDVLGLGLCLNSDCVLNESHTLNSNAELLYTSNLNTTDDSLWSIYKLRLSEKVGVVRDEAIDAGSRKAVGLVPPLDGPGVDVPHCLRGAGNDIDLAVRSWVEVSRARDG